MSFATLAEVIPPDTFEALGERIRAERELRRLLSIVEHTDRGLCGFITHTRRSAEELRDELTRSL